MCIDLFLSFLHLLTFAASQSMTKVSATQSPRVLWSAGGRRSPRTLGTKFPYGISTLMTKSIGNHGVKEGKFFSLYFYK